MRLFLLLFSSHLAMASQNKSSLNTVFGDQTTAPIQDEKRAIPGDKVVPPIDGPKIDEIVQAKKALLLEQEGAESEDSNPVAAAVIEPTAIVPNPENQQDEKVLAEPRLPVAFTRPQNVARFERKGESITLFKSNLSATEEETITIPSGAHAFGRVKFGEEVTATGESEVVVQLDYAFLGPNESVVEMNGCIAWLKVSSNFHTQKVKGSLQDMTCTMPSGRVFSIPMEGPIVGATTGYAGVESDLIMRGPAKAAALKFLGEITSAYGAATSAAETTTEVVANEYRTDKTNNVSGDKKKYVGGKVLEANGEFLKYISSFFDSLQPTLALAPGAKVHVVNRFNIKVPKVFFKIKGIQK